MRHFSHQKPNKCPNCGSPKVVKIIYGEPSYKDSLEAEAGKVILGECIINGNDPSWACIDCNAKIFKRKFRAFP
jgi:DNA-directed RNA polymerase subunit RPC12/RpoP